MRTIILLVLIGLIAGCATSTPPKELTRTAQPSPFIPSAGGPTPPPGYAPEFEWDCWISGSTQGKPHIRLGVPEGPPFEGVPEAQFSSMEVYGKLQPGVYQQKGLGKGWLFCMNNEEKWFDCAVAVFPNGYGYYKQDGVGEFDLICKPSHN